MKGGSVMKTDWTQPTQNIDVWANAMSLMPAYRDIPDEFTRGRSPYYDLANEWFFRGLQKSRLRAKAGIDANTAFRHLSTIQSSWDPPHEHKTAGVAYLMSLWFDIV